MTRRTYTLLIYAVAPIIWAWLCIKGFRTRTSWRVFDRQRFGRAEPGSNSGAASALSPVWVHAVSVGETRAAEPLIRALLSRGERVLLTHTTPTGRETGATLYADAIKSGLLRQAWYPYDFPYACRRFLRAHAPRLGILIEREVWPNMVAACRERNVPITLVSARLSERGMMRALKMGKLLHDAYGGLDLVCAQTESDLARLVRLGVSNVVVCGNLKFDVALDAIAVEKGRAWRRSLGRRVVTLASTREGEVELFGPILSRLASQDVLVVWIPRHPQRFGSDAEYFQGSGLAVQRRTLLGDALPHVQTSVYLGDTLGEMAFYYGASDVAIVGGGFAPLGGQNFIEACAAQVPVIIGPNMHNFREAAQGAAENSAVLQVASADDAVRAAQLLLEDAFRADQLRVAAQAWTAEHRGATLRIVGQLDTVAMPHAR